MRTREGSVVGARGLRASFNGKILTLFFKFLDVLNDLWHMNLLFQDLYGMLVFGGNSVVFTRSASTLRVYFISKDMVYIILSTISIYNSNKTTIEIMNSRSDDNISFKINIHKFYGLEIYLFIYFTFLNIY